METSIFLGVTRRELSAGGKNVVPELVEGDGEVASINAILNTIPATVVRVRIHETISFK